MSNYICLVEVKKDMWIIENKLGMPLTTQFRFTEEWQAVEWAKAWLSSFQDPMLIHISSYVDRNEAGLP